MKTRTNKNTKHIAIGIIALLLWAVTFYTDTKIFSGDGLNMNCLPIDLEMVTFMHVLTKALVLLCLVLFGEFLVYAFRRPKLLIPFLALLCIYGAGLLITYPGYYMNDDPIIFSYATRYYPVYWHNYLTSLFYMTAMSLFPMSAAPVLLSDVIYALVFSYIYYRADRIYDSKWCRLALLAGILPFTLLGALMCFRPAIYSGFFVFYFVYLYFEWKEHADLSLCKLLGLALLTAVLALWRSESLVMLPIGLFLIGFAYHNVKKAFVYLILSTILFMIVKIPQSIGEDKYYGSDYLIISTTRPLSVIVHRDQTYEGAAEDIANVSAVTEFGYLHNDSLSCSAYNRYNSDHNEGRYTQTGASGEMQSAYLKSAFRLIAHNLDLYFGERIQLFCVTNGFFGYDKDMVLNLKPVASTNFHLYEHDRDYGMEMLAAYKRLPLTYHEGYAMALFAFGGEAFIPMLVLLLVLIGYTLVRRKWFLLFGFLALLAREAVIFLTAPASFIQYSYPMMYTTAAIALLMLIDRLCRKTADASSRTKEATPQESLAKS
ncbi:MAG: hypothetical protein J6B19_03930 [Lachnospiraceae bacterium]|nr:hypothetical protein [Lachnospiraceae bacterium]